MEWIRVLFGLDAASRFGDLRDGLAKQPDMVVLRRVAERGLDLLVAVREEEPDVVVVELQGGRLPGECSHVLAEEPHTVVLALGTAAEAKIFRFDLQATDVSGLSTDGLANAIRTVVRPAD